MLYVLSPIKHSHLLAGSTDTFQGKIYQDKKETSTYTMANGYSGKEGNYKTKNSKKKTDKRDRNIIANWGWVCQKRRGIVVDD